MRVGHDCDRWRQVWVDEMIDAYADWRETCVVVQAAYDRWANTAAGDEPLAFGAYEAALDTEERASLVYAEHVRRVRELFDSSRRPRRRGGR